jgi:hypothetical protein
MAITDKSFQFNLKNVYADTSVATSGIKTYKIQAFGTLNRTTPTVSAFSIGSLFISSCQLSVGFSLFVFLLP